jgi:hypothetical protein
MKDKYWHIDAMDYLLFALSLLGILLVILSHRAKNDVDSLITTTDTITVTDTITDWRYDTVFISRLDTVKLPIVHTDTTLLIDTLIDSIYVQVPLHTYHYDTIISDSTHTTAIQADIEGFAVRLAQLSIETKITPQRTEKQPWYGNLCPAVGVGFGTGGFGVFAGIGFKVF